ncbi:ABC transporter substrate-binding protein [Lederbergia galactosidilytica]|uniref:LacI family transcriptional regulator n=1 Tax=Lederbergia galactosidilytica TaxID=217031 RepID=A0A177ZK59_9BACI|nr:ABC transporter substrate-binding protein [Lederbergia galactosidilytica]MBP1914280.1 ribose transport system substrate-binding protein [Lederbergia galactosidilytica]OAK67278.1 LacI family transcriptional regulator [Lederbergia galactosidilytica]
MKKSLSVLAILILMLVPILSACNSESQNEDSSSDSGEKSSSEKHKIGILAPAVTHGWVAAVAYHAEARAKELSDEIDYKIQTSSNAEEMTSQLDDLMTWGAEAIVAFPQWEGMEIPIQTALDAGIKVVNFDIEIDADGVYRVSGDNEGMGVEGAKYIIDKIGTEGNVVVLEVPSSGSVSKLRKQGFMNTMEEMAPDMNISTYATQFTREDGLKDFADILTSNKQIDAVYSMDDETSIGVLQAISEAGRDDIKVVTGGGGMQEYFKMMPENEDIWIQSALYSPAMVKDAVDVSLQLLNGEEADEVTIIPTTVVDRDNYEEFIDEESPY